MPDVEDGYAERLADVARLLADHQVEEARSLLVTMDAPPMPRTDRRSLSNELRAQVFRRDCFQCRYCGRKTVLRAVLRMISRHCPEEFPYHNGLRIDSTHEAAVLCAAEIDHVYPVARGGDFYDPANLATVCHPCNRQKGHLRLRDLGWSIAKLSDPHWRGLTEYLLPMILHSSFHVTQDDYDWQFHMQQGFWEDGRWPISEPRDGP